MSETTRSKIRYTVKGDVVTRHVSFGTSERTSSLKMASWMDRSQDAGSLYDLAWLTSRREPELRSSIGEIRTVDLFCGCGGLSLGVVEAARALGYKLKSVFASDINKNALDLYLRNFNPAVADSLPIEDHVDGELDAPLTERERQFVAKVGAVDMLVAGPPCQGNSDLNNHTRRNDPKNLLYLRAVRCAEILKPDSILIENVPGVLHEAHGVLQTAVAHLTKLGYSVSFGVVHMKQIGVAQNRRRMILMASRIGKVSIEDAVSSISTEERPLSWACGDLIDSYDDADVFNSSAKHSVTNQKRIHYLFEHDLHDLPNSQRPDCHRLKQHGYTAVYGRMYWDMPAPTITGGFGSCGQGRFVHPHRERTLTPHEAARVQFFPDYFDFSGVLRRELQQVIGNAVPSKAGFAVALPLFRLALEQKERV